MPGGGGLSDVTMVEAQQLPIGPMTVSQQMLAEALGAEEVVKKGRGGRAGTKSSKPSPAMKATPGTPKTILPIGTLDFVLYRADSGLTGLITGMSAEAASQLSQKAMLEGRAPTTRPARASNSSKAPNPPPAAEPADEPPKTKTSHRAAEQKRRDSLKAGFDELRLLLPPIIVDPDSDEALLPGSAPPRGPQRNVNFPPGSEDHPNRGVSKLALLRCSNEFIARLNKRVERRDVEMQRLRDEVKWLRDKFGVGPGIPGDDEIEWVDLEMDIDEVERDDGPSTATGGGGKARVTGVGVALLASPAVTGEAGIGAGESKWPAKSRKSTDGTDGGG